MEIAEPATQPNKRQRQDNQSHQESSSNPNNDDTFLDDGSMKRHKPYNNSTILNLLDGDDDDDEQEPSDHDLSAMFTTFQRELAYPISSFDDYHQQTRDHGINTDIMSDEISQLDYYHQDLETASSSVATSSADEGDESVRSVMRDLLEASDDELGIPNSVINDENDVSSDSNNDRSGENLALFGLSGDYGFWEIEDEAANCYTVLQSQLFMQ